MARVDLSYSQDLFGSVVDTTSVQINGAEFSECRKYRYALWRLWSDKSFVMFIGLNPSTANETKDDNTIKSVQRIAKNLGYGGVYMMNLFPFISTDPKKLKDFDKTAENDWWLKEISAICKDVIFSWGNFPIAQYRSYHATEMFPNALALRKNKNGTPAHPLYIPSNIRPIKFLTIKQTP